MVFVLLGQFSSGFWFSFFGKRVIAGMEHMEDNISSKFNPPAGGQKSKLKRFWKLVKVWLMIASRVAQTQLLTSWGGYLFLAGKIIRFLLYFVVLFSVLSKAVFLAGYQREQVILFFLVFNLVDVTTQAFFRGVYRFRPLVVRGNFDLDLLRPLPSFFRPVFGWTDIWDLITLIPLLGYFAWFVSKNYLLSDYSTLGSFVLVFLSSLVLAFSFHLLI